MLASEMRNYLSPYSIFRKRATTIANAFASAEAPVDVYDTEVINTALSELYGEAPSGGLKCIYCDRPAETWDHLFGLVKDSRYSGYGHRIRNLVPCCKACNSSKGNKNWEAWLKSQGDRITNINDRMHRIRGYAQALAPDPEADVPSELREQYTEIRTKVMALLKEADEVAGKIRAARQSAGKGKPTEAVREQGISRSDGASSSRTPSNQGNANSRTSRQLQQAKPKNTEVYKRVESDLATGGETMPYSEREIQVALRVVNQAPGTIGRLQVDLIRRGLSDDAVLSGVREKFPGRATLKTVKWHRQKVRVADSVMGRTG
jgi:hypothetical protein